METSNRERAIQLRQEGLSRSQICRELGLKTGGRAMSNWLKDVPAPEWTKRPRAKDELREMARALRREGKSYREIREQVPVSKGTLSLWLADIVLTEAQQDHLLQLNELGRSKAARTIQARRLARQEATTSAASSQIPSLAESELFVAGVAAYWAEGSKSKPWRPGETVTFINSDATMIHLFLRWLELIGVSRDRLIYRLHIHETADVDAALSFWAGVVDASGCDFARVSLKRNRPGTNRKNRGDDYHGCLVVYVRRSTDLLRQITGWWEGITRSLTTLEKPSGVV